MITDEGDKITPQWCQANGAEASNEGAYWRWRCGGHVIDWDYRGWVWINRRKSNVDYTCRQLLALLAALRGEPSGQAGQLHVSRGQLNGI